MIITPTGLPHLLRVPHRRSSAAESACLWSDGSISAVSAKIKKRSSKPMVFRGKRGNKVKTSRQTLRVDGWEKVSGSALYAADVRLPGLLFGRALRSTVPHALIKSVDASAARKML